MKKAFQIRDLWVIRFHRWRMERRIARYERKIARRRVWRLIRRLPEILEACSELSDLANLFAYADAHTNYVRLRRLAVQARHDWAKAHEERERTERAYDRTFGEFVKTCVGFSKHGDRWIEPVYPEIRACRYDEEAPSPRAIDISTIRHEAIELRLDLKVDQQWLGTYRKCPPQIREEVVHRMGLQFAVRLMEALFDRPAMGRNTHHEGGPRR